MGLADLPHWALKLIGTTILFILCMTFGSVPMRLRSGNTSSPGRSLFISLSNCFAGGVFFSTVILDLFPMVKVKMHEALISVEVETEFPVGDFLVGVGFLFMLLLEQIIHSCCQNAPLAIDHGHSHGVHVDDDERPSDSEDEDHHHYAETDKLINGPRELIHPQNEEEDHKSVASIDSNASFRVPLRRKTYSIVSVQSTGQSNFRSYILVFAISLHSIFEGLALGLIVKSSQLIQIFIAMLIHKSIIAFSIGVQLVDARLRRKAIIICMFIFSAMTPLGVGLGVCVLQSFNQILKLWFSGVLQAFATGTFLYVTFFEVLPHELNIDDNKKTLKIIFVIIGYALVTGVCTFENRFHRLKKIKPDNSTVLIGLDI